MMTLHDMVKNIVNNRMASPLSWPKNCHNSLPDAYPAPIVVPIIKNIHLKPARIIYRPPLTTSPNVVSFHIYCNNHFQSVNRTEYEGITVGSFSRSNTSGLNCIGLV